MKDIDKNLIPFQHEDLDKWRANFTGGSFTMKKQIYYLQEQSMMFGLILIQMN